MLQQGTNEAENTKEHYLLQEKSEAWGGWRGRTVAQHSYVKPTVHKHTALLLLSEENPITPILMILTNLRIMWPCASFTNPRTREKAIA